MIGRFCCVKLLRPYESNLSEAAISRREHSRIGARWTIDSIRQCAAYVVRRCQTCGGGAASIESSVVDDITPFLPGDTVAFLRIADDDRPFPFRPVSAGLFLIGQGAGCDLRLGHDEMPALHSVIQLSENAADVNCVAEHPSLFVNGEHVKRAHLGDGDLIEIGDVRLVFQFCRPQATAAEPQSILKPAAAVEFVDAMESELSLIDALQLSGTEGIHELLKAAHDAVEGLESTRTIRFSDYSAPAEEEQSALANVAFGPLILTRLQSHESRLNDVCHVLEQVVKQQQLIATALQCLAERIDELKAGSAQTGSRRASA